MRISDTIEHLAAPEQVFAALCSPQFQDRKCRAGGALEHEVAVTPREDGGALVRTRRRLPTGTFPDFVRQLVGATILITETQDWGPSGPDGSRSGTLRVEVDGAPVGLDGTLALEPAGTGSTERIEGDLKARVPLVGGRIEKAAAPAFLAGIRVEGRVAREWLESS